jgi:flagellar basal body-associated protein FliL
MNFIVLLFASALSIASVAAFFSIYGLANIYTATFWSVVIMGATLEVGKLVAASFLQRYWTTASKALKAYLVVAVIGLMIITSAGIFGYLSNAYQQDSVGLKDVQAKVELLKDEETKLSIREQQIDADVNRVGENYVRARIKLMDSYKDEKKWISERRRAIRQEMQTLSTQQLQVEAHTGPIIYIARAFDQDVDTAIKWMTLLIIFVFDPLAIALTLAGNHALMIRDRAPTAPQPTPTPPPAAKREEKFVEDKTEDDQTPEEVAEQTVSQEEIDRELAEEPTPTIDTVEQLDEVFKEDVPPPTFREERPTTFVPPKQRRFTAGDQSDFARRMIKTTKNS